MSTARKLLRDVSFPAERIENLSIDGNYESSALEANENNNKSETNQTNPSPALLLTNMAANVPFQNNNSKSFSKNFFLFFFFYHGSINGRLCNRPDSIREKRGKKRMENIFQISNNKCAVLRQVRNNATLVMIQRDMSLQFSSRCIQKTPEPIRCDQLHIN